MHQTSDLLWPILLVRRLLFVVPRPFPRLYIAVRSQQPLLLLTSIALFKGVEPTKKGWSCGFMTLVHLLFIWKSHHPVWRGCTLREVMKYCHWPAVQTICLSQGYSGIWWRVLPFLCGLFHLIGLDSLLIFQNLNQSNPQNFKHNVTTEALLQPISWDYQFSEESWRKLFDRPE